MFGEIHTGVSTEAEPQVPAQSSLPALDQQPLPEVTGRQGSCKQDLHTECSSVCMAMGTGESVKVSPGEPAFLSLGDSRALSPAQLPQGAEQGPLHPSAAPADLPAGQQTSHGSCTTAPGVPGQIRFLQNSQLLVLQLVLLCQGRPDKAVGSASILDVPLPSARYPRVENYDFSSLAHRLGLAPGTTSALYKSHTPALSS